MKNDSMKQGNLIKVKFEMGYVQLKKERYDNFKNILEKGAQKRQ